MATAGTADIMLRIREQGIGVLKQVRDDLAGVQASALKLTGVFAGLGVVLAPTVVFGWVRGLVDGIDALNDVRDATGATIENISALQDVAGRAGTEFGTVTSGLVRFNQALRDAKPGTDAAAAFKALGLDVAELRQQDPAEALRQTAVALSGFADDANKARLLSLLFGRSIAEITPFLNDLAEQGRLVATVTSEQAKEAEIFNKQLAALSKNVTDVGRSVVGDMLPGLNQSVEAFVKAREAGKSYFEIFEENRRRGYAEVWQMMKGWVGISAPASGGATGSWDADWNSRANARLRRQGAFERPSLPAEIGGENDRKARAATFREGSDAGARYIEMLEKMIEREQGLSEVQKAQNAIVREGIQGRNAQQHIVELASRIDTSKRARDAAEEEFALQHEVSQAFVEQSKARERISLSVDGYVRSIAEETDMVRLQQGLAGKSAADRDLAIRQYRIQLDLKRQLEEIDRADGLDEAGREVLRARARAAADQAAANATAEAGMKASDALASSIEDGIMNGFRGGRGLADVFIAELKAQFAKTVLRPLIQPVAEAGNKLIEGLLGGMFFRSGSTSVSVGNMGADFLIPGFANGGRPPVGKLSMVGERGPELFVPQTVGTILPTEALQALGTGGGPTINMSIDARGADVSVEQRLRSMMPEWLRMAVAEVQAQANRGGAFARSVGRR